MLNEFLDLEKYLEMARNKWLPPGYKPEDYSIVSPIIAKRIARFIVREAIYLSLKDKK